MKPKLTMILFLAILLGMFSNVWADVTIGSGTANNGISLSTQITVTATRNRFIPRPKLGLQAQFNE